MVHSLKSKQVLLPILIFLLSVTTLEKNELINRFEKTLKLLILGPKNEPLTSFFA